MAYCSLSKDENRVDHEVSGLELTLSVMASYPHPYIPLLDANFSTCFFSLLDETRDHKRPKRATSIPESIGSYSSLYRGGGSSSESIISSISHSSSTGSPNSLSKLCFRDHIRTYTQRYLAAEAVEEAAEAMTNTEEGTGSINDQEDGSADAMKLLQLLIACTEAVACRDKSYASALLSELRADALVFGSSFQRVASCFVQGLADRLAQVQPLGTIGFAAPVMNIMDNASDKKEEAFRLVYEICPHIQFGHFVAIFDSLDAMLPKYDTRRAKMEQFYFVEEIKNIVSCEGPARMERHEKLDQWRRRMSRAGFQAAPIKMVAQAKQWLQENYKVCEGYTIVEEKGCLVLGWKSKPIVAASCWKC
ncbi:DELLA protein SLR1-like [Carica papaya]|uniref:DELLA protein SLR1-like n=1 Tax=Carica papaya TaxID=3649 RepID=UPI000B8C6EE9|nr:DELLA protein SLR1-like [Carica papaya]